MYVSKRKIDIIAGKFEILIKNVENRCNNRFRIQLEINYEII